ncbi:MAG: GNAT family protein, partial [Actinomycetota bacterium]|nr:GNAT family protein [Actinomycetota bacterium]
MRVAKSRHGKEYLRGQRVMLRALKVSDFQEWKKVRLENIDWLTKWEPTRPAGMPDVINDRNAFGARCNARDRERHLGSGYGFGIFVNDIFCGEINISSIQRGPFQSCYVGYWIDEGHAGNSYTPEALAVVLKYAFEDLNLHRVQVAIIPRNTSSRRVVEKLSLREEGIAERYLEINGEWEDHIRYAFTSEEWDSRKEEISERWI